LIKKGITLIEMLVVLSLFSIISIVTYSFIISKDNVYLKMSNHSDNMINNRIAMEYLVERVMDSQIIQLREYTNPEISAPHIRVETKLEGPTNLLVVDSDRLYIKKDISTINGKQRIENIIRCDTDSQQVVPGIYAFEIWDKGNGLYLITLFIENPNNHEDSEYPNTHSFSSFVKRRNQF
jgi:prepilin-type N-terminal cleavage/methylation domain-containing protein